MTDFVTNERKYNFKVLNLTEGNTRYFSPMQILNIKIDYEYCTNYEYLYTMCIVWDD